MIEFTDGTNVRVKTGMQLYNGHVREHAQQMDVGTVKTPRFAGPASLFVYVKFDRCRYGHRFLPEELELAAHSAGHDP